MLSPLTGRPTAGMALGSDGLNGEIVRGTTNEESRCPDPLQGSLAPGRDAIRFAVVDYFRDHGIACRCWFRLIVILAIGAIGAAKI